MKLNEIKLPEGRERKRVKRVGRGSASGQGGTAGKGHKGQKARAGGYHKTGFEGGQMPLQRRLPKRGFHNLFRKVYTIVNLDQLAAIPAGTEVSADYLLEKRIIRKRLDGLKILGRGELASALKIKASAVSDTAKKKIEAKGGTVEVIRG